MTEGEVIRMLFLNVVAQAVRDAFFLKSDTRSKNPKTLKQKGCNAVYKRHARYWLTQDGSDFYEVCALAGVSADRLRKKAIELMGMPCEQRRAEVNRLMRDCYEWNRSSANKGKSKKYF